MPTVQFNLPYTNQRKHKKKKLAVSTIERREVRSNSPGTSIGDASLSPRGVDVVFVTICQLNVRVPKAR